MIYLDYIPGTNLKIYQSRDKFSFGVDRILLSSFSKMKKNSKLLDIGAGTGILSMRCSELYGLKKVVGVEIQEEISEIFRKSLEYNKLKTIEVVNKDIVEYGNNLKLGDFDYIISNPPYIRENEGVNNLTENDQISRTEKYLKISQIFNIRNRVLNYGNKLFLINRPKRVNEIIVEANKYNLTPKRMQIVQSNKNKRANLVMFEFVKGGKENFIIEPTLIINEDGKLTKEVENIYEGV